MLLGLTCCSEAVYSVGLESSGGFVILPHAAEQTFINEREAMIKPRFQFKVKGLLLAVALLAGPLLFLRPLANGDAPSIDVFGVVHVGQDGSIEVQGGSVRISRDNKRTEIRANRIVVQKDGTAEVNGPGTLVQTTR